MRKFSEVLLVLIQSFLCLRHCRSEACTFPVCVFIMTNCAYCVTLLFFLYHFYEYVRCLFYRMRILWHFRLSSRDNDSKWWKCKPQNTRLCRILCFHMEIFKYFIYHVNKKKHEREKNIIITKNFCWYISKNALYMNAACVIHSLFAAHSFVIYKL